MSMPQGLMSDGQDAVAQLVAWCARLEWRHRHPTPAAAVTRDGSAERRSAGVEARAMGRTREGERVCRGTA